MACWIAADRNQTELAILNLVVNARDAMPLGGTLRVTTETGQSVNQRLPDLAGDFSAIIIEDSGVGMPPEVAAHALEPFFTTKCEGQGTGLGLSMVHGFAMRHGGKVTIRSRVGQGTVVNVYLPVSTTMVSSG